MKKIRNTILIICLSYAVFLGCDNFNNPVASNQHGVMESSSTTSFSGAIFEARINNYDITTSPGVHDPVMDVTTFTYSVSYAGSGPSSNNFYLEIPECAVDKLIVESLTSPSGNSIVYPYDDPRSGTTGVLWNSSLSRRTSNFNISFNGNVTTGNVSATVQSGNRGNTGEIAGPCKGNEVIEYYEVSGYVFVDVNDNDTKDSFETGIPNVVVSISGNGINLPPIFTDILGKYSFTVPASSKDYVLSIPRTIGDEEFNTKFYESYDFTGSADNINDAKEPEVNVSVTNADVSFDFPFSANTDHLILQFEKKTIFTNTRDFDFWRSMVRHAANQTSGDVEVSQEMIYEYLDRIERNEFFTKYLGNLLPDVPYQFEGATGPEKAAYALEFYLFNPSDQNKTPLQIFLRELLVAELNIVSGIYGVAGFEVDGSGSDCQGGTVKPSENGKFYCNANTEEFHLALLAYGEGLAAQFLQPQTANSQKLSTSSVTNFSLESATEVFSTFNRTGSGGLDL